MYISSTTIVDLHKLGGVSSCLDATDQSTGRHFGISRGRRCTSVMGVTGRPSPHLQGQGFLLDLSFQKHKMPYCRYKDLSGISFATKSILLACQKRGRLRHEI